MNNICFIALGSNLNQPLQQVQRAIKNIQRAAHVELVQMSSWYRNPPLEDTRQPDYINGVAEIITSLSAFDLLDYLQTIEQQQGRTRGVKRWQARTLDLDILLYNHDIINSEHLQIPHPRMCERAFVLYPLYELKPNLTLPSGDTLQTLIAKVSDKALEKIIISS